MRNILIKTLLCCFSLHCVSCPEEIGLGYPSNISFTKEGGEKTFTGDQSFTSAIIQDYKGNYGYREILENGELYNVYDWLEVEYVELYNNEHKLYAPPNTTYHHRSQYIELY